MPRCFPDEAALHADSVVVGEAEPVWRELLEDAAAGRCPGRATRRLGLHSLAYAPTVLDLRFAPVRPRVPGGDSRGCRLPCEFCSISPFFGHRRVERPVEEVVREVRSLSKPVVLCRRQPRVGDRPPSRSVRRLASAGNVRGSGRSGLHIAEDRALLNSMRRSGCQGVLVGFGVA